MLDCQASLRDELYWVLGLNGVKEISGGVFGVSHVMLYTTVIPLEF